MAPSSLHSHSLAVRLLGAFGVVLTLGCGADAPEEKAQPVRPPFVARSPTGEAERKALQGLVDQLGVDAPKLSPGSEVAIAVKDLTTGVTASFEGDSPYVAASAAKAVWVAAALRAQGVRWIEPFEASKPPTDAERDAVLTAAVSARLIVDLTRLPAPAHAAARTKLGSHPATFRLTAPIVAADVTAALAALNDRRNALGPHTLLLLSGGAENPVLTAEALAAPSDAALAPVAVVAEDTTHLEGLLGPMSGELEDPKGAARLRVKALFGGSIADLLRRLP